MNCERPLPGALITRALILALYLLQGGVLLPLHHHAEESAVVGPRLESGCHAKLPCSDPGHPHPAPPHGHPRTCVACGVALRPAIALGQVSLPTPAPIGCEADRTHRCPAPRSAQRAASERAPPGCLPV